MEIKRLTPDFQLGTVILAAGASTRMGSPKMLLPWGDSTIAGHLLSTWSALARQVAFVISEQDQAMERELTRLGVLRESAILNPKSERGMFSSIQCAAAWRGWNASLTHFVIILGDQPHLDVNIILKPLLQFAITHPEQICQPAFRGRPKHPIVLPRRVFNQLLEASFDTTLKEFLTARRIEFCAIDDEALNIDLDYPAQYEQVRRARGPV